MPTTNEDIGAKLDTLIKLSALQLVGDAGQTDAIKMLGRAGLDTGEIAKVVGTTPGTVRSTLARARRSKPTRRAKRR